MQAEYRALPGGDGGEWSGALADAPATPRHLVPVAPSTAGQGIRKMPVKSKRVELDGEWAGWHFDVRTNVPLGSMQQMTQLDAKGGAAVLDEVLRLLPEMIVRWNYVNEAGDDLPCTEAGVRRLPQDLLMLTMNAAMTAFNDESEVDKSDGPADPGLSR